MKQNVQRDFPLHKNQTCGSFGLISLLQTQKETCQNNDLTCGLEEKKDHCRVFFYEWPVYITVLKIMSPL